MENKLHTVGWMRCGPSANPGEDTIVRRQRPVISRPPHYQQQEADKKKLFGCWSTGSYSSRTTSAHMVHSWATIVARISWSLSSRIATIRRSTTTTNNGEREWIVFHGRLCNLVACSNSSSSGQKQQNKPEINGSWKKVGNGEIVERGFLPPLTERYGRACWGLPSKRSGW